MPQGTCPHCGSASIVANISVGQTAEVGSIGLNYKTAMILVGTEPFMADLCGECGTVTRLHVQNLTRKWRTVDPS
jgi:ribosomal protein S27AE